VVERRETLGATAITLTADDLRAIDSTTAKVTVHGARYPERLEKLVGR